MKTHIKPVMGVFRLDEVYTFSELRRRGFGSEALRAMQSKGLLARVTGRQKIVLGADLIEYFAGLEPESTSAASKQNEQPEPPSLEPEPRPAAPKQKKQLAVVAD